MGRDDRFPPSDPLEAELDRITGASRGQTSIIRAVASIQPSNDDSLDKLQNTPIHDWVRSRDDFTHYWLSHGGEYELDDLAARAQQQRASKAQVPMKALISDQLIASDRADVDLAEEGGEEEEEEEPSEDLLTNTDTSLDTSEELAQICSGVPGLWILDEEPATDKQQLLRVWPSIDQHHRYARSAKDTPDSRVPRTDDRDNQEAEISTLLEQSAAIQKQLHQLSHATDDQVTVKDIVDRIDRLLLEYDRSSSRQSTPGASGQAARVGQSSLPSSGEQGSAGSQSKRASKQPVSDQIPHASIEPAVGLKDRVIQTGAKVLRCFYHFGPDNAGKNCPATKKNIRDMIVHWISHRVVYCPECSQYFTGDTAKDDFQAHCSNHQERRICIDIDCSNRTTGALHHERRAGCEDLRLRRISTRRKYYSLFRQALPGHPLPSWGNVEIEVNGNRAADRGDQGDIAIACSSNDAIDRMIVDDDDTIVETLPRDEGTESLDEFPFPPFDTFDFEPNPDEANDAVVASLRDEIVRIRAHNDLQDVVISQQALTIQRLEERLEAFGSLLTSMLATNVDNGPVVNPVDLVRRNAQDDL